MVFITTYLTVSTYRYRLTSTCTKLTLLLNFSRFATNGLIVFWDIQPVSADNALEPTGSVSETCKDFWRGFEIKSTTVQRAFLFEEGALQGRL